MLRNKTNYYVKIKHVGGGIAMVRAGAAISIEEVSDYELMCIDLNKWEILDK